MSKPKVVTVFGTRPEIIKMAVLIPLLDDEFDHTVIFTSQHYSYNMAKLFFEQLGLRDPDIILEINSSDKQSMEASLSSSLDKLKPALVTVYGDTNSAIAAARAAKSCGAKLAHLEAGLRSYDERMPEEHNRIETDKLSDFLFAPTGLAKKQLEKEGMKKNIYVVGNTIVDSVKTFSKKAKDPAFGDYILLTAHRQENVDDPKWLSQLLDSIAKLSYKIVFPMHPRTKKMLEEFGYSLPANVKVLEPVGYFEFLGLMKNSSLVLTDSGGVQEECICLHVPCLTVRSSTERWEIVAEGGNFIVGSEPRLISSYVKQIIDGDLGQKMRKARNPLGDGKSSKRIARLLKSLL
jgi:UDP-N-acetylglucosamine 2-epimerase (non-hydrolysing)